MTKPLRGGPSTKDHWDVPMRLSEPGGRPRMQAHLVPPQRLFSEDSTTVSARGMAWTGLEVWVVLN